MDNNIITFATRLIYAETGEYPLSFSTVKARNPNTSFPMEPTSDVLEDMGYFVVHPTAAPSGDVVTEIDPGFNAEGQYVQEYAVRSFNADEIAQQVKTRQFELLQEVTRLRDSSIVTGVPINFGGDFGVQHIQVRDGDRANIIGLRIEAQLAKDAGSTDLMGVRSFENVTVPMTNDQVIDMSIKALNGYRAIMSKCWHFQDMVKASETMADFPELPADFKPDVQDVVPA